VKISYFEGTDSLYIEFSSVGIAETGNPDEGMTLHLDASGGIGAMTVEHASQRAGMPKFSFEHVAAYAVTAALSDRKNRPKRAAYTAPAARDHMRVDPVVRTSA